MQRNSDGIHAGPPSCAFTPPPPPGGTPTALKERYGALPRKGLFICLRVRPEG
jgi:hypothetical protein